MQWAWVLPIFYGACTAFPFVHNKPALKASEPPSGRSFLASAWRAARAGTTERWQLGRRVDAANPAPAPAPAPLPPRPQPNPPQFPVIGQDECDLFAAGFMVSPGAACSYVQFAKNMDGCTCELKLPANINPQPANFYNPFLIDIPPDPNIPLPAAMPTVPPPSNPMQPYIPPMMPPECPFIAACADVNDFNCVGFNSWGFGEAGMAGYSPAAAALNSVSCSYYMKPYGQFKVPQKVAALWHLNAKTIKVFQHMSSPIVMQCGQGQDVTSPTQQVFCKDKVDKQKFPCTSTWKEVAKSTAKICASSPPPDGFERNSTLAELCPLECGWKKGVTRWPPYLTAAEVREKRAAAKKAAAEKKAAKAAKKKKASSKK